MIFRLCRHIKTDGIQCQSPAMQKDEFCYFHTELRRRNRPAKPDTSTMRPAYDACGNFNGMEPAQAEGLDLGLLEDTAAVQIAISTVVNALANNRLELRRATALLYGLQLAASNCRSLVKDRRASPREMVRAHANDAAGEPIANPGLYSEPGWVYDEDANTFVIDDAHDGEGVEEGKEENEDEDYEDRDAEDEEADEEDDDPDEDDEEDEESDFDDEDEADDEEDDDESDFDECHEDEEDDLEEEGDDSDIDEMGDDGEAFEEGDEALREAGEAEVDDGETGGTARVAPARSSKGGARGAPAAARENQREASDCHKAILSAEIREFCETCA